MTLSAKLSLGKFVVAKPRANGTHDVVFKLPPALRPSGWSATTPLPIAPAVRAGDLTNETEVRAIQKDAKALYERYLKDVGKGGEITPQGHGRDMRTLVRFWQGSQEWKDNKPRTNKGYDASIRAILRWTDVTGNPDVAKLAVQDLEQFLGTYDDRPTQKYALKQALSQLFKQAVKAEWRATNPVSLILVKQPKTTVTLWTKGDVKAHVDSARKHGQPGVAAAILTQWEIGQRITDLIAFRHGWEYDTRKGVFRFKQSKTGEEVVIPVSAGLRELLAELQDDENPYLFREAKTNRKFRDDSHLWHVFKDCAPAGSTLTMQKLRHSAVMDMVDGQVTVPEIISVTGHTLQSANMILSRYMSRSSTAAESAQRKRGLIG